MTVVVEETSVGAEVAVVPVAVVVVDVCPGSDRYRCTDFPCD